MRKSRILGLAAQAVAGGVGGIILGSIGAEIALRSAPEELGLLRAFAFLEGGLIGYTLGTLSGVYVTGKLLRREWSFWVLFSCCLFGVGFAVSLIQWWFSESTTVLGSLVVFIPPTALTLVWHLFGHLKSYLKAAH